MELQLSVRFVKDHEKGKVFGAPEAKAGDFVSVPFKVGASLIASEYAVAEDAPAPKQSKK